MEYWVRVALSAAVARMHVCASQYLVRLNILKINQQLHNCCGTKHDFELGSRVEQEHSKRVHFSQTQRRRQSNGIFF